MPRSNAGPPGRALPSRGSRGTPSRGPTRGPPARALLRTYKLFMNFVYRSLESHMYICLTFFLRFYLFLCQWHFFSFSSFSLSILLIYHSFTWKFTNTWATISRPTSKSSPWVFNCLYIFKISYGHLSNIYFTIIFFFVDDIFFFHFHLFLCHWTVKLLAARSLPSRGNVPSRGAPARALREYFVCL